MPEGVRLPEGVTLPSDAPTPLDSRFHLELPNFEGPLDLLLFLIKKHTLDILDLPIAFVTERYAEYIRVMEQLNLDVAAEYLVMAATLAHIKSKSLLPKAPEEEEEDEEDGVDPREELIKRLLEYQKYRRAAEQLSSRGVAGRDVFPRGIKAPQAEGPAPLKEVSVFKLIDIFQKIVERHEGNLSLEIDAEQITIQERMGQITELLSSRERVPFEALFEGYATTYDLVVSFLALLEMAKMRLLRVFQVEGEAGIYLEGRVSEASQTDAEAVAEAFQVTSDVSEPLDVSELGTLDPDDAEVDAALENGSERDRDSDS